MVAMPEADPKLKRIEDAYRLVQHRTELAFDLWQEAHPESQFLDREDRERLMYEFAFQYITGMSRSDYCEKYAERIAKGWRPTVSLRQYGSLCKVFCIGFQRVTGRYAREVD